MECYHHGEAEVHLSNVYHVLLVDLLTNRDKVVGVLG